MTRSRRKHGSRLLISLLITLVLVVPAAYVLAPWVSRQVRIGWLTSDDLTKRQQGLSFVAAHALTDDSIRAGAVKALDVPDDLNFAQIVDALQAAECWQRRFIPDTAWLRWITLNADAAGIEAPALAAQRLADLQDLADDPRLIGLLNTLSHHDEPDVRYNALCAAAELFQSTNDQQPYRKLITDRLNDADPVIAHHARLLAHLTNSSAEEAPAWFTAARQRPEDQHYNLPQIQSLLYSSDAPLRDAGCVLAARDLDQDQLTRLIAELLRENDSPVNMAGAILTGMTGHHRDLLLTKINQQTDWVTASVMKLGLWMLGDTATEVRPEAILVQGDVPRTTIILAMLHHHDPLALEVLLNPRGEAPDDLAMLLQGYGWWRVLDRYLPEDAPRWQSTTDPALQQNQIDLLRDWYLLNRHRLLALQQAG